LGAYIAQGNALLALLRDPSTTLADTASNVWATEVEGFLTEKLAPSYVTRFRSDTGILLGQPAALTGVHLNYWLGVRNRVYNLERFSAEVPQ
jgi:hypothetical protein